MKKENQEVYASPHVEVIEIKAQAVICQSGPVNTGNPFGDNEEEEW